MKRLRLVRRNNESWLVKVAVPILSILLAILVGWNFSRAIRVRCG